MRDDAGEAGPLGLEVETDLGRVRGDDRDEVHAYLGIPYASPPIGELRFEPPAPHPGWSETRDATAIGPECPQAMGMGVSGDEDCLTLNVWAPVAPAAPRPVMFWIHGGAFTGGTGGLGTYDGTSLARTGDLVVVTINYRLGALGFLARESLASAEDGIGNYGIQDQIAALEWVSRNIARFGGDPDRVTIFGESAGGMSVCSLLGAPRADRLYSAAIIQSGGGCDGYEDPRASSAGRPSLVERHSAIVEAVGCGTAADEAACLRGVTVPALVGATGDATAIGTSLPASLLYVPNVDGVTLAEEPFARIAGGRRTVPIMIGSNADEAFIFTLGDFILTWAQFETRVRELVGTSADAVIAAYPRADFMGPKEAYNALVSDVGFICPTLGLTLAASDDQPVFLYHYTHVMNGFLGTGGALHAAELPFVFGNFPGSYTPDADDLVVSAAMQRAWTSFARDHAPDYDPSWPRSSSASLAIAIMEDPSDVVSDIRSGRCAELRRVGLVH
jgi:para-nitrobenzyl esterase